MESEFQERRRSPRVLVKGGPEFHISRRQRVRLLDISASGALIASEERLPVGSTGRLQVLLDGALFEATVAVKREEAAADGRGRLAGVALINGSAAQDVLEDFLRRAGA